MNLTTLVVQLASNLGVKLWKVVMKYKNYVFKFQGLFFQQNVHFCSKLWHFFSAINYSINSSVIVYKIQIFMAFFLPRNRCFDNWKVSFSMFSLLPLVGEHIPSKLCSLSKHPWKNRVKQIKTTQENLSQMCILCPVAKDPDPSNRVKKQKVFFFNI